MARRKGQKCWEGIHRDGWLALYGDTTVMTDLMMEIFACLYHSPDRTDNAKHIAQILNMEYRALNAAVGWAGNKIKDICEAERKADAASQKSPILVSGDEPQPDMSPWEYVFNGIEDEDGTYLWIMKEAAADAFREMMWGYGTFFPGIYHPTVEKAASFLRHRIRPSHSSGNG